MFLAKSYNNNNNNNIFICQVYSGLNSKGIQSKTTWIFNNNGF